ncbi:MAG: hypothetical protein MRY49_00410 [Candidatus Pacebacteria bacterium]|nr:hypothetical protein [Candidatus Paceibacterota bacterium]
MKDNRGLALAVAIIFIAFSLTVIFAISAPVLAQVRNSARTYYSKQSFFSAEAGLEDVLYRLKNGMEYSDTETLSLNGGTVETTVVDDAGGKTVTADGSVKGHVRNVGAKVITGQGASFSYALQAGTGGFDLAGGSVVNGSVYSNGEIIGHSGVSINGNATAADLVPVSTPAENTTPIPSPQFSSFAYSNTRQDFAQSFQVSNDVPLNTLKLYITRSFKGQYDITVRIAPDDNGWPSLTTLDYATLEQSDVTTNFEWVDVIFDGDFTLEKDTTYWFILDADTSWWGGAYYRMATNFDYPNGRAVVGQRGGQWRETSPEGMDGYFQIESGTGGAKIEGDGGSQWWQPLTVNGDSWAPEINFTNTTGTAYCQSEEGNNEPCDTSREDPPALPFPITDEEILGWKADAEAGYIYNGNLGVGWQGTTTGPIKVNGDLTINGGGDLTLTGTIWVTGDITVSGGGSVQLASSYGNNSGIIISDGNIDVSGNGQFQGSGQSGSYPIVITTSACPFSGSCQGNADAIEITGGSGAVVLIAQDGVLSMNGGTSAKAMSAHTIEITGGGQINYDSGLADITVSSGSTGGWNILYWDEVE